MSTVLLSRNNCFYNAPKFSPSHACVVREPENEGAFCFGETMKEIQLTRGMVALVSDEDFERVNSFKWCANRYSDTFYAARGYRENGKTIIILLHRFILNAPKGKVVDHRNGNGLDCQRENIRMASYSENSMNMRKHKDGKFRFKGICFYRGRYDAQIYVNGKHIWLGSYPTEIDAALAYNSAAKNFFGEFAQYNSV